MLDWKSPAEWKRIFRYYQTGVVNTAFGYGVFAAFVALGLNVYLAQLIAHALGIAFNYLTYSGYAFKGQRAPVGRFIASYAANYLMSAAALALFVNLGLSPYAAGLLSIVVVSLINYFVLAKIVFAPREER